MQLFKNYAATRESTKKKFETSAEFELNAEIAEDDMFDQMCPGLMQKPDLATCEVDVPL